MMRRHTGPTMGRDYRLRREMALRILQVPGELGDQLRKDLADLAIHDTEWSDAKLWAKGRLERQAA